MFVIFYQTTEQNGSFLCYEKPQTRPFFMFFKLGFHATKVPLLIGSPDKRNIHRRIHCQPEPPRQTDKSDDFRLRQRDNLEGEEGSQRGREKISRDVL